MITDENDFSSSATASVLILPTNDPSVFSFANRSLTFNETTQTPVYLFQENDTLVDSDGDSLQWIAIEIRPFADDMDVLSVDTGSSGLNVSINSFGSTILNISGYASFSVYEAVLQTVTFHNSYPGLSLETRVVEVVTFDGETESPPTLISVSIAPFDDIPVCYFRNSMVSGVCVITSWISYHWHLFSPSPSFLRSYLLLSLSLSFPILPSPLPLLPSSPPLLFPSSRG